MLDFVLLICEFCARFCASDLRILCSILCFGFANVVLDFVLRICECCARFCASDLRILCSILCFGFANFVLDFVLRICGFCARPCAYFKLFLALRLGFSDCASDLRILCSILCFGFANFVLDFVLRICGFCARFCASDLRIALNLVLAGIQQAEIRSTRNQDLEHEKSGFGAREIRKFSLQLRLRKSKFWCSRPVVLVLLALGSGAPGPWFRCSALQAPGRARKWFLGLFVIWLLNVESSS